MASSLDDLLTGSAPPTTPRTASLDRELTALVGAAEVAAPAPSRRRKRIAIAGLVVTAILGGGAAAGATGLVPTPWFDEPATRTTQTSHGETCQLAFSARGLHDPAHPVDAATRAKTITAADTFLADFDFSTLQRYEGSAMQAELERRLSAHLTAEGLPPEAVSVAAMSSCMGSEQ